MGAATMQHCRNEICLFSSLVHCLAVAVDGEHGRVLAIFWPFAMPLLAITKCAPEQGTRKLNASHFSPRLPARCPVMPTEPEMGQHCVARSRRHGLLGWTMVADKIALMADLEKLDAVWNIQPGYRIGFIPRGMHLDSRAIELQIYLACARPGSLVKLC